VIRASFDFLPAAAACACFIISAIFATMSAALNLRRRQQQQ